jgi:glycosyltransferase involved in cell wall biosynthesis
MVPNALEWPSISPVCEKFARRWKGRDFLLFVGDPTSPRKNLSRTIEALGPLGHPFLIVGPDRNNSKMEELRALAGRYPNVHFLGFLTRDELWEAYCTCKAVVLASINEGTGLAALEAAGMGAQVIITRHGGASTYFGNKAIYVEPRSIRSIRAGVIEALNKPKEKNFADSVRSSFGLRTVASIQERAYKDLIGLRANDPTAVLIGG